jgi:hypothetical protein
MNAREFWIDLGQKLGVVADTKPRFEFAAGEAKEIEIARPGTFNAKRGGRVTFTPTQLAAIATSFDPASEHKIKLGHKDIDTDTPDYGDVVGLKYDEAKGRLFAAIKPTESLVEKNRKGEFHRVSMELDQIGDGKFAFDTVSFLGAHGAAIPDLARVALASGKKVVICAADDVERPDAVEDEPETTTSKKKQADPDAAAEEERKMDEATKAALDAEKKQLAEERKGFAIERVKTFMAGTEATKRFPMEALKPGSDLERLAIQLAADDLAPGAGKIKLAAGADGAESELGRWATLQRVLLAFPEKLTKAETTESGKEGAEDEVGKKELPANVKKYDFAAAKVETKFAKSELHEKTQKKMAANEKLSYEQAQEAVLAEEK